MSSKKESIIAIDLNGINLIQAKHTGVKPKSNKNTVLEVKSPR